MAFGSDTSLGAGGSISPAYRYGYQSQELQSDTGWESFKWRNYDPTYARFFNADPLSEEHAYQSHYNFSENRVINGKELERLEWIGMFTRITPLLENTGIRPIIEPISKPEVIEGTVKTGRFSKEQLEHFDRGRKVELEQINKMNEEGQNIVRNTKNYEATDPKTGKTGETRPDGFTEEGRPVEVKNVKKQGFTRQLRFQDNLTKGKRLILRINKDAQLTKPLKDSGVEIQPYNLTTPLPAKVDNTKANTPRPAVIRPKPVRQDGCAKIPNCA